MPDADRPVAIVTGASRRVGLAIALELARRGCDLALALRSPPSAAEGVAFIRRTGARCDALELELSSPELARSGARRLAQLPRADVLVHNASVYELSPLAALDPDALRRQLSINALAPLVLSAELAPLLSRSPLPGRGAIVAMLDIHAESLPRPGFAAYEMSKSALGAMVRSLARELAPGVRVNAVSPGVVAWPEAGPESDPACQARYLDRVPLARAGTPEDAARAVAFLALDAHYTTGQVLRVDGGRSLL